MSKIWKRLVQVSSSTESRSACPQGVRDLGYSQIQRLYNIEMPQQHCQPMTLDKGGYSLQHMQYNSSLIVNNNIFSM